MQSLRLVCRDAVGRPGLLERGFMHPVLATFVRAIPVALGQVGVPVDTAVHLRVLGEAGDDWSVERQSGGWTLYEGVHPEVVARVLVDGAVAWRVFTKGLPPGEEERHAQLEGDRHLAAQVLHRGAHSPGCG